jgi:hypothetical protein
MAISRAACVKRGLMPRFVLVLMVAAACGETTGGGPQFQDQHPRIYIANNKDRLVAGLAGPAGTRFQQMVDRWVGGADVYGFESWNAALMGQLTGDAKYCTAAIAAVDKEVAAAEQKIGAGSAPDVAGDNYLQVGPMIGNLALVFDWCHDAIPSERRAAWLAYANQAVTNVWGPMRATWGGKSMPWSGWAIDDPNDNYYYSFLRATMLLGLAAHGEAPAIEPWLTEFHDTRLMGELVPTFEKDLVGGGSREGTGYGVSHRELFALYDLWHGSTGEVIATKTAHTRASMLSFIHQTLPTLDRVAPTGDQARDSTASLFDYHRAYLAALIAIFPTDPLAPRAQALLASSSVPKMSQQFMYAYDFLYENADVAPSSLDGLGTAYYAPGIGQLYARSSWDPHATWINLTAGPYTESHAHQDQGALLIYKDGWLAYDPVVDSHSGLTQGVDAHGTVRIDDGGTLAQRSGTTSQMLALHRRTGWLHAAADITPVYKGKVGKLQREIVYLEPDCVVIYDRVASSASQSQTWSLAFPAKPTITGTQTQVTASGHTLTVNRLSPDTGPTATVHDYASDSDFTNGFRLDEQIAGGNRRWLHVAYIDGAVTAQSAPDANTIQLTLAGGTTARVAFDPNGVGGTLTIGSSTVTLGAGVDPLPE